LSKNDHSSTPLKVRVQKEDKKDQGQANNEEIRYAIFIGLFEQPLKVLLILF